MKLKCEKNHLSILKFSTILIFSPSILHAADPFKGVKLLPTAATYLVLKDVNIRAKPKNKSARLGRFRKFERIEAVGKASRTKWIAVKKGGRNLGFVYSTALVPVIDGKLANPIVSSINGKRKNIRKLPPCSYQVKFVGKFKIEKSLQITSDYSLDLKCNYNNKTIKIHGTMFLTELPYLGNKEPVYQINVDLFNIPKGEEDMFSSTILYHALQDKISFAGVNKEALKSKDKILPKEALNLIVALKGAVVMAHRRWGPIVWTELEKIQMN